VGVATFILLFFAIQSVVRPLGELQKMAQRIKEGDFSVRNVIHTDDEIGILARILNLMAEAIEDRTVSLEQSASDLQNRERELRMQHNLLNAVIESMSDGLILLNFQGKIRLSNKAAGPLLNLVNEVGSHIDIQKCESHLEEGVQCVACMKDLDHPTSCVITVDNTIYEILSTKVQTVHGSSKVLVMRDITERELMHRRQAHQERLTVLGNIATVVSHEINNPLAAISMYSQMMESELPEDSPFSEHVDVIKRNIESCQRITKDLLAYARTPKPDIQENERKGKTRALFSCALVAHLRRLSGDESCLNQGRTKCRLLYYLNRVNRWRSRMLNWPHRERKRSLSEWRRAASVTAVYTRLMVAGRAFRCLWFLVMKEPVS